MDELGRSAEKESAYESMNTNYKFAKPLKQKSRLICLVLGIVVFGVLMGIRQDLPYRWQRTLAAASAGGVFGLSIYLYRKSNKPDELL